MTSLVRPHSRTPRGRGILHALGPALIASALIVVALLYALRAYNDIVHAPQTHALWDFRVFYGGDRDFLAGGSLYRESAVLPFTRPAAAAGYVNLNSPVGALVLLPFSLLSLQAAAGAWESVSLLLLLSALVCISRVVAVPREPHWRLLLLVCIFVSFPVLNSLWLGTWGMVVAFLDIMTWYSLRRGAARRAGLFLGLALMLRWQPFVLLLYLLMHKRWRAAVWTLLAAAAALGAGLLVFGASALPDFVRLVLSGGARTAIGPANGSIHSTIIHIASDLSHGDLHALALASLLGYGAALLLLVATLWRSRSLDLDAGFSLCLTAGLLVTPLTWFHYHVAMLAPLAILLRRRPWVAVVVVLFWLSIAALSLDLAVDLSLNGVMLTASLLLPYAALWHDESAQRGREARPTMVSLAPTAR